MSDPAKPLTLPELAAMKQRQEKIACLTAYDASCAQRVDEAGTDIILVGDSLGMVVQGHGTTLPVKLDDMAYHTRCVARGTRRALILADLPFMSYATPKDAVDSAAQLIRAGAHAVKLEGAGPYIQIMRFLTERNIAVSAHLGLLPQSIHRLGGYKTQARDAESARQLLADAKALADAGASLLVLECIPADLARQVTAEIAIPTIGIGAGPHCDGQVLVLYDLIGLSPRPPRFSKNFMSTTGSLSDALRCYVEDVKSGAFPRPEHSA
jgi:3-methyl-2-oxobutanoate hydroxymethyltransferase